MKITYILVEPAVPENIGAAARAMNTMGFTDLRLVNPTQYLSKKAQMLAHGSQHILEQAKLYDTLQDALHDMDFIIGTSAKTRSVKCDYVLAEQLPVELNKKVGTINNVALVFGREESGLTNPEIHLCDRVSYINLAKPYPSLNLGQAVMLYAYELRRFGGIHFEHSPLPANNIHSFKALKLKVENLLDWLDFEKEGTIYNRIMERFAQISAADVNLLHSIIEKIKTKTE